MSARRPVPMLQRPARSRVWLGAWLLCLCAVASAAEDVVEVRGDALRGKVVGLSSEGVSLQPIHGKGEILIQWADVESLRTEEALAIMYGDRGDAYGRILGIRDGGQWLLVGSDLESAQRISTDDLFEAYPENGDLSTLDRLRSAFRYWEASLDGGAAYTDSSTDQALGFVAFRIERDKAPTRWLMEGSARYATQKEQGEERDTTENILVGFTRGELDMTDRTYSYLSTRATHDADQHLSLRFEPRGGLGVHVVRQPRFNFSSDVGVAWVYEDYFGDEPIPGQPAPLERGRGESDFWAVAFGAQANAKLPLGAVWRAKAEYLPAVDDWENEYLIRGETSVEFPLLEWLSFKVAINDEYDNTPAEGSVRNKVTTSGSFTARFP